ncbi:MAG: hypothetical protein GC159_04745 [Phycisphaera sp.]|nr:hypothetical protein [Phycisphaera sp.]
MTQLTILTIAAVFAYLASSYLADWSRVRLLGVALYTFFGMLIYVVSVTVEMGEPYYSGSEYSAWRYGFWVFFLFLLILKTVYRYLDDADLLNAWELLLIGEEQTPHVRHEYNVAVLTDCDYEFEASSIIAVLAAAGIRANMIGALASGFRAEAPGQIQILVRGDDLQNARTLIGADAPKDPTPITDSQPHTARLRWNLLVAVMLVALFLVFGYQMLGGSPLWVPFAVLLP